MRAAVQLPWARLIAAPAALLIVACGGGAAADEALDRDLALAASDGLAMPVAPASQTVSAIEGGPPVAARTPTTRRAPTPGAARPARRVVRETAEPEATETVAAPVEEPTIVAAAPSRRPSSPSRRPRRGRRRCRARPPWGMRGSGPAASATMARVTAAPATPAA
jgi:hypothetical protein